MALESAASTWLIVAFRAACVRSSISLILVPCCRLTSSSSETRPLTGSISFLICFFEAKGQSLPIPASMVEGITKLPAARTVAKVQMRVVLFSLTVPPEIGSFLHRNQCNLGANPGFQSKAPLHSDLARRNWAPHH